VIGLFPVRAGNAQIDPQLNVNHLLFPGLAASAPLVAQTEFQASPQPLTVVAPDVAESSVLGADDVTDAELQSRALAAENSSVDAGDLDTAQTRRVAMYRNYEILPGDTVTSIANEFGLDANYITWNNPNLEDPNRLSPGVQVIVPYVEGIVHAVEFDETLSDIARRYDADTQDILDFGANSLSDPNLLKADTFVFVPGGRIVPIARESIRPGAGAPPPTTGGAWLWPTGIAGTITSRYTPWHPLGIDIALPTGNAIIASRGGVVRFAGGDPWVSYGYYIKIDHGDGWETTYAHLQFIPDGMTNGTVVSQGDYLAPSGNTGNSTGPHLHFETRWYGSPLDPFDQLLPQ
jgi:murein DD-endopeptidase MepM/ murein hydrolase activator NlpD